jgi:Fic family protein
VHATETAQRIVRLKEQHQQEIAARGFGMNEHRLIDVLFRRPLVNVALVQHELGFDSHRTASKTIDRLVEMGFLEEITGRKRDRVFRYTPYIRLFESDNLVEGHNPLSQVTETLQQPE